MTSRRSAFLAAGAFALAGLLLAAVLARQHAQAHAGVSSFCSISAYVDCDRVATSRFSVVLGLPIAVWGMAGYALALALALAGLRPGRVREGWPAGLLFLVAAAAAGAAVVLALVSELAIGALCLLCAGSWVASLALLAAAWRACGPGGVASSIRGDLRALFERPLLAAGLALLAVAPVLVAAAVYPRYWERRASAPQPGAGAPAGPQAGAAGGGTPGAAAPGPAASGRPLVVVEFSDYECPFCAKSHEETKALLASRPDVTLARRHFPLDSECNPVLKRRMHPQACGLALAAICAEEQGKLEPMDDALFRNQQAKRPVEEIATAVGLDLPRFRRCVASPEAAARLRSDVEAGIRVGVQATPTYVIGGRAYSGGIPPEVLPPPREASAGRAPRQ